MPAWKQLRRQIGTNTLQRGKKQLPEKYKLALRVAGPTELAPKRGQVHTSKSLVRPRIGFEPTTSGDITPQLSIFLYPQPSL